MLTWEKVINILTQLWTLRYTMIVSLARHAPSGNSGMMVWAQPTTFSLDIKSDKTHDWHYWLNQIPMNAQSTGPKGVLTSNILLYGNGIKLSLSFTFRYKEEYTFHNIRENSCNCMHKTYTGFFPSNTGINEGGTHEVLFLSEVLLVTDCCWGEESPFSSGMNK